VRRNFWPDSTFVLILSIINPDNELLKQNANPIWCLFGVNPSKAKYPKIREPSERGLLNLLKSRQRNLFWILVGFNKFSIFIKLFLFTKRNSFWRQINRKSVITIQIWIDLTRFRTDFSLKSLTLRCIFYRIF